MQNTINDESLSTKEDVLPKKHEDSKSLTVCLCCFFLFSLALYIIVGVFGLFNFHSKGFFTIITEAGKIISIFYLAGYDPTLLIDNFLVYIFFYAAFGCAAVFFIIILISGMGIWENTFYKDLFTMVTRITPIPLILTSVLLTFNLFMSYDYFDENSVNIYIAACAISGLSLVLSVLIYCCTRIQDKLKGFITKKCFLSSLISVNLYIFCYSLSKCLLNNVRFFQIEKYNNIAIIFGVAYGVAAIVFMLLGRDLVTGFFSIIAYIGILKSYLDAVALAKKASFPIYQITVKKNQGIISGCFIGGLAFTMVISLLINKTKVLASS